MYLVEKCETEQKPSDPPVWCVVSLTAVLINPYLFPHRSHVKKVLWLDASFLHTQHHFWDLTDNTDEHTQIFNMSVKSTPFT